MWRGIASKGGPGQFPDLRRGLGKREGVFEGGGGGLILEYTLCYASMHVNNIL